MSDEMKPERVPWTGTTAEYDETIEALARAQSEAVDAAGRDRKAYTDAIGRACDARARLAEVVEEMIDWSVSRAYAHIHATEPESTR